MGAGIFNIVMGGAMIVGAAWGNLTFIGTNSSLLLGVLGVAVAVLGVYQVIRARRGR